jgi:two-component system C4-dicarboxylate transport sensor histidine kinase DctB
MENASHIVARPADSARASPTDPASPSRQWLVSGAGVLAVIAILAIGAMVAGRLAADRAMNHLGERARAALPLAAVALVGEIEKQRLIPLALARDPSVIALLRAHSPAAEADLDRKLKAIAEDAGAAVIYVIGTDGRAIAASNAGEPTSFVGSEYQFRHYFRDAMANGTGAQYSLGTVSGRPGLYLSRRVEEAGASLGVVVVKVELDEVEANWRASGAVAYVTDEGGVIVATTVPEWRFSTMSALGVAQAAAARDRLQIGEVPLSSAPIRRQDDLTIAELGGHPTGFAGASGAVGAAAPGWNLTLLLPADAALADARRDGQITALLGLSLLLALGRIVWRRRQAQAARQMALAQMNAELEARVEERTDQLRQSNTALAAEIAERETVEAKVHRLRDELAQANRLSILGQIAAGVAHEMNQPLAAIRVYAGNAKRFFAIGKPASAEDSLNEIVALTERIAGNTDTLRSFARRASSPAGSLAVEEAIDGALSLLSGRIRDTGVQLIRPPRDPALRVIASRIRLEQILVNLLQNALDALQGRPEPRIEILRAASTETVWLRVRDNGPGLDPAIRAALFMPFTTSKDKGLGLGLVISAEIARELGGDLRLTPSEEGACFTVSLSRAPS